MDVRLNKGETRVELTAESALCFQTNFGFNGAGGSS